MKYNEIIAKIVSKLFPEFSNKITWTIVISGLGLISTPLLEKIVYAILKREFDFNITDSNDAFVGISLVVVGLVYNFFYFKEKNKKIITLNNEPCVTVDVFPKANGNLATVFNIAVKNSGASLAKNIRLQTDLNKLETMFASETSKESVLNCFSDKGFIPFLLPEDSVENSFGVITLKPETSTWKSNPNFEVTVCYQNANDIEFKNNFNIKFDSKDSFAGSCWAPTKS